MTTAHAPMRLVCPGCGVYGSIETFASDADARAVASLLAELQPDVASAVQRYLRLFAPARHALTWHKARKQLGELVPMIKAGEIRRSGRNWPAPSLAWISAIDAMVGNKNLDLPMKSHGYLLEIIEGAANKAEAQIEKRVEGDRLARRPARTLADQDETDAIIAANVRTATAMLVTHATVLRTRFREDLTDDEARKYLGDRFGADVIDQAIAALRRSRK